MIIYFLLSEHELSLSIRITMVNFNVSFESPCRDHIFLAITSLKLALKIQTITTNQGLNVDTVNWADRATEAWAYGKELTLDCRGKPVKQLKSLVSLLKYWIQ